MPGFGSQYAGSSPAGFGAPTPSGQGPNVVLPDEKVGGSHGSRMINPVTRDYVINAYGRLVGMSNVHQLVQIAITKASPQLEAIDRLDGGFEKEVLAILSAALVNIVNQGFIEVLGVETRMNAAGKLKPGQAVTVLKWRDLTTKEDFGSPV